jgi:hypothetical protein
MTDLRQSLFNFLDSKTDFTVINQMVQYKEPDSFVGFYIISDEVQTMTQGNRVYNATTDVIDKTYAPIPLATIQIDVRGVDAFNESRNLFYGLQMWQDDMLALGLHFRGVGNISPIPNVQNGYVKEGYQFNLFVAYDTSIVSTVNIGETLTWQLIDKQS